MKKLKKKIFFIFGIKSHNAEKNWKEEPFGIFQHPFCRKTSKKSSREPFEEKKFRKKNPKKTVSQCRKKLKGGDSLVSPGMICYAEKQVKPFWSSSLGQLVLFDTIIFCRTFKNYFGQFVWIEKKRVTIIVAFHFMKRRLKNFTFLNLERCADLVRSRLVRWNIAAWILKGWTHPYVHCFLLTKNRRHAVVTANCYPCFPLLNQPCGSLLTNTYTKLFVLVD